MPKLSELIKMDDKARDRAQMALLEIEDANRKAGMEPDHKRIYGLFRDRGSLDVSLPLIRYVYSVMRAGATYDSGLPHPYKWKYSKRWAAQIIREEIAAGSLTDIQIKELASTLMAVMRRNGICHKPGRGKSRTYWLADWDGETLRNDHTRDDGMTVRDVHVMNVAVGREDEKPVRRSWDLAAIKTPDPNPQAVLEYVQKLTAAFNEMRAHLELVESERDGLQEKLDEIAESDTWAGVVERLSSITGDA